MIAGSFRKGSRSDGSCPDESCGGRQCPEGNGFEQCAGGERPDRSKKSLKPSVMLPYAFATSIDALAVGVSFAFLKVSIVPAVLFIGTTTLILSMLGVKIGNVFGRKLKAKAELAGGVILVLIGLKILLEHVGVI